MAKLKNKDKTKNKDKNNGFMSLFSSYLWLGVVLVLLAIIVDKQFPEKEFFISSIVSLIESIGIAIIVASIFTFVSGTSEFINKIRELLQDIVVSRNFLGNIDPESKREALNSLIKPSSEEKLIYSNIEDYLNTYISQAMDVTKKCVRSNYNVSARAFFNQDTEKVCVNSDISYRLYPTKEGYSNIKVGFLESEIESTCTKIVVNTPHGGRKVFDNLEFKPITIDAGKARLVTVDLKEYEKSCSHLDIALDMKEVGLDHWIMLSFGALMPTDGFKYSLRCENGLKINGHHTFIHGAKFYIDNESDIEMTISCNEWVNEGTGISILISHPHEISIKEQT